MRKTLLAITLSIFSVAPALAARSPAETVSGFYKLRLENNSSGTPSGMELAAFSSYLAPELVCMLGAAMRYGEQYAKTLPNAKPPFAEGDLYSSRTEGPTRFKLGTSEIAGQSGRIRVRFFRDEEQGADDKGWEDVIHLSLIRKRWLISDIEYAGTFSDANHGSLKNWLNTTLSHPEAASRWDPRELSACELDTTPAPSKGKHSARDKKHGKHSAKANARAGNKAGKGSKAGKTVNAGKAGKTSKATSKSAKHASAAPRRHRR